MDELHLAQRVSAMREAFDGAFVEPHPANDAAAEKFLAVHSADSVVAFRVSEIGGIAVDRKITPVPSPVPELVGITGIRGRLVSVYSLTALLRGAPAGNAGRWLVLVAGGQVALATEGVASYLSGHARDLVPSSNAGAHCAETLRAGGSSYSVVDVPSLMTKISMRVAEVRPRQER